MLFTLALLIGASAQQGGVTFRQPMVTVLDDEGAPLFRSSGQYALEVAKNSQASAFAYDLVTNRIRISAAGPALWVSCSELIAGPGVCDSQARPKTRSIRLLGKKSEESEPLTARGLPSCPGDPRCPKT